MSRSGVVDQPPLTHSGRRYPSPRIGSLGSSDAPPPSSLMSLNRSNGDAVGIVSSSRSCSCAHTRSGSARQPPKINRCTAAMSQPVATRTPASTSATAVSFDHITQRGRNTSSTRRTTFAKSSTAAGTHHRPVGVAMATPTSGATTIATRSPRAAPLSRNSSSTPPMLRTLPPSRGAGRDSLRRRRVRPSGCQVAGTRLAMM